MAALPEFRKGLTFDDVLLCPAASSLLPAEVDVRTQITRTIRLNIPLISSAMDTVTEADMGIAMAQVGGLGVLHRNMSADDQANEVRRVKKFESGIVVNPVTIAPDAPLTQALALMRQHNISGVPVVDPHGERLVGILTNRDLRFASSPQELVRDLMTKEGLVTVKESVSMEEAKRLLHKHRIEKLPVVDEHYRCIGLLTVKDMEKASAYPHASKDSQGRLRVGAAVSVGADDDGRAQKLIDAGVDLLVVDTAHGHSDRVIEMVGRIRKSHNEVQIAAGNVATGEGVKALIDAGADAVKVGIGPGSICTTRIVAGVGVPQLTAIMDAVHAAKKQNIPIIADGGIKYSGDLAKALAAGASCAMIGTLLAGSEETPGDVFLYQGRSYKPYRGMGSLGAMADGSADRYAQESGQAADKLVPEGVEGRVPCKGSAESILYQLIGGLRAAMGYIGAQNLADMHKKAQFIKISPSALRESHVHGVSITREAPNYPGMTIHEKF